MTAPQSEIESTKSTVRALAIAIGLILVVFGFLPIANWISGGHAAPWYRDVASSWISGSAIVVGVLAILTILSRQRAAIIATLISQKAGSVFEEHPRLVALVIAGASALLYAVVALIVFGARPIFIDELIQVYQARLLAAGTIAERVGPFPEFFGALNVVSAGDRQFGQFPPGGPAHLAIGVLAGVPWLVMPLAGGAAVFVFAMFVRRVERESAVALGATLLLAGSPFMIFMSASHMNHVPTLLWVLLTWLAAAYLTSSSGRSAGWGLLLGFSTGVAATVRPVDALVLCVPAVLWCFWSRRGKPGGVSSLLWFAAGAALPLLLLFSYNAATTGSPLRFGYDLMWGRSHSLGFHDSPWGVSHTPARGVELLNLYFLRLQSYLFESPAPSLLPAIAALIFARRRLHGMLLATFALLAIAYFAYWHDGFYLGPRFFFVALPALVLLTAQAPRALGEFTGRESVRSMAFLGVVVVVGLGLAVGAPERGRYYARSLPSSRHQLTTVADTLGVHDAVIFVRESWGSQVLARMWGRGIDRPAAELLYRSVDTCMLDSALAMLEQENVSGQTAGDRLLPLLADSSSVRPSTMSPDRTLRSRVGTSYSERCLARVAEDQRGMALYPLVLAQRRGSNMYARDLGERNELLMRAHVGRKAYLLMPRELDSDKYELRPLNAKAAAVNP